MSNIKPLIKVPSAQANRRSVSEMLSLLLSFLDRRQKLQIVWFIAVSVAASIAELFGMGLILFFVQSLDGRSANSWLMRAAAAFPPLIASGQYQTQINIVLMLFAAYGLRLAIGLYYCSLRLRVTWDVLSSLMGRYFRHLMMRTYVEHGTQNSGDLVSHLNQTCIRISKGVVNNLLIVVTEGVLSVSMVALLVYQQPALTIGVSICFLSVYWFVHALTHRMLRMNGQAESRAYARHMKLVMEALQGYREIKIYGLSGEIVEKHEVELNDRSRLNFVTSRVLEVPRYIIETNAVFILLAIILVLLLNGISISDFSNTILLLAVVIARILPSANRLSAAWAAITNSGNSVFDLAKELAVRPEPTLPASEPISFKDKLVLDKVTFVYPDCAAPAISEVSLVIPHNSVVGFIGTSGSGKTTLLEVIIGLLRPQSGTVSIDDQPLTPSRERAWLERIGYVPQETYLIDDTIGANIAFGRPLDAAAVQNAAAMARLHDFITALPQGYETRVGERGVLLSGGQRQRIGIARALYANPELLILDEATSALDLPTENEIRREIARLKGQLTILIVAHRLSTLTECDTVFLLESGKIAAHGTLQDVSARFLTNASS